MSPDFCGLEQRQMAAQDYWNFTTLETGEYFDKKIDTKTMFKNSVYLTDDQGDAVLRVGSLFLPIFIPINICSHYDNFSSDL